MLSRRSFLAGALASIPLSMVWRGRARASTGALVPDPDGLLDLPPGYSYRIIDRLGDEMTDGYAVPGSPDGMACFAGPGGTLILMRNHELSNGGGSTGPLVTGKAAPEETYDAASQGGVTRVVLDAETLEVLSSNLVLYGTIRNCGGGASPWGWLSCEEDVSTGHGYTFLCPIDADTVQPPQRITGYGRFMHEGAVVDPTTRIAYLTEDRSDSCFYRFVPDSPDTPFVGKLQALKLVDAAGYATKYLDTVGDSWLVEWVDVPDPDPSTDSCRAQAYARGAARFARGEGIWMMDGSVYFTATGGGPLGNGQVWRLDPDVAGGALTLLAVATDPTFLDAPDNLTVSPAGDVYLCEDGELEDKRVQVLRADGTIEPFIRKVTPDGELAGVCFSPDGTVMFMNLLLEGITVAITGFPPPPNDVTSPDTAGPPGRLDRPELADAVHEPGCSAGGDGAGTAAVVAVAAGAALLRR